MADQMTVRREGRMEVGSRLFGRGSVFEGHNGNGAAQRGGRGYSVFAENTVAVVATQGRGVAAAICG